MSIYILRAVGLERGAHRAYQRRAQHSDPLDSLRCRDGPLRVVEPDHLERRARREHDVRRMGVDRRRGWTPIGTVAY